MRLLNVVQNTPEWYALRRTKIGASDCSGILSKNPYTTPLRIWRQKIFDDKEEVNGDMQRGIDLEEKARQWISEEHKIPYKTACIQSEEREWQIASLDCFYGDDHSIFAGEIKSPRKRNFYKIQKNGIPDYWSWQIQHQLSVTGLERMFLLLYTEEDRHIIWINRDKKMIQTLEALEEVFYFEYMLKFNPPPLNDSEKSFEKFLSQFVV